MHTHLQPPSEGGACPACSRANLVRIDTTATRSHRGDPMAVLTCRSCNWREGWVRNNLTGHMMLLWSGRAPNATRRRDVPSGDASNPYARV